MPPEDFPQPLIFAHRGASSYAPENTLAAFELALQQGAPAIELDAKLCADGHVVVIHDQTVDRTTFSSGRVKDLGLSDLRRMDAGSHFDICFKGEKIPTLEEVLITIGRRALINIELTNYGSPRDNLPYTVAELVSKYDLVSNVLFSSFNPIALVRVHRLLPTAPIGLLALTGAPGAWARSWLGRLIPYQSLHPELGDVNPKLIRNIHKHARKVIAYTVNQEEDMRRLIQMGVDGFFSDDPVLALEMIKSQVQSPAPANERRIPEGELLSGEQINSEQTADEMTTNGSIPSTPTNSKNKGAGPDSTKPARKIQPQDTT